MDFKNETITTMKENKKETIMLVENNLNSEFSHQGGLRGFMRMQLD